MRPPKHNKTPGADTMGSSTEFYGSQAGGGGLINYTYTDFPGRLLMKDVYYFFAYCWALPWIFWPLYPFGSDDLDELYPSLRNMICVVIHFILVIIQLAFILALPFAFLFPGWMVAAGIVGFVLLNKVLCMSLNGPGFLFESDKKYAKQLPEHEHEKWVFLNGVAVGSYWMKANLNRLAITFGRPILGIHNRTAGIVFDVLECLIQRNLNFATNDIRVCYRHLKEILYDPKKSKVVFILHSQGGIEGSMVIDWLLQEVPQDLLGKLEVYSFGNAANHFNNPHRHIFSQSLAWNKPLDAIRTLVAETSFTSPVSSPVNTNIDSKIPLALTTESSTTSSRTASAAKDRAIGHIEHYAHNTDFVSMWGILHFSTNKMASPELPRFLGRVFNRSSDRGGHLLNQHYLDGMFPLKKDPDTGAFLGADEKNAFMEEVIKFGKEGSAMDNAREAFAISYGGTCGFGTGEITTPVEVYDKFSRNKDKGEVKVKELSRLWCYRNGLSPPEQPPMLVTELVGLVRNATL